MKAQIHVSMSVPQALEKIGKYLTEDKFLFSEEEVRYIVHYIENEAIKKKNYSSFWSRRDLSDKYPKNYSIEILGTLEEGIDSTIINIDIIEYHHGRAHSFGGTRAIEDYFEKFCRIFEK